jgi:hypothetical protein
MVEVIYGNRTTTHVLKHHSMSPLQRSDAVFELIAHCLDQKLLCTQLALLQVLVLSLELRQDASRFVYALCTTMH